MLNMRACFCAFLPRRKGDRWYLCEHIHVGAFTTNVLFWVHNYKYKIAQFLCGGKHFPAAVLNAMRSAFHELRLHESVARRVLQQTSPIAQVKCASRVSFFLMPFVKGAAPELKYQCQPNFCAILLWQSLTEFETRDRAASTNWTWTFADIAPPPPRRFPYRWLRAGCFWWR